MLPQGRICIEMVRGQQAVLFICARGFGFSNPFVVLGGVTGTKVTFLRWAASLNRRHQMKWILVVLAGGVAPVPTDLTFEKLSDCLVAEQQLRETYADALDALRERASSSVDRLSRREQRQFYRARDRDVKRFANTGTCIPHTGSDQPITSLNSNAQPPQPQAPPAAPATTKQ